ncbi:MAG: TetR/AcrR family transcriptional regulator [Acidobacteriota bacterium]
MPYPARIDRKKLAEQALEVAEAKGWDSWSLRDVAAHVGVTVNALYRHVDDRAHLVLAMGVAAAGELRSALEPIASEPDDAVVEMSRQFVDFAMRRPHAYAALTHAKPDPGAPEMAAWTAVWVDVHACVRRAVPESGDAAAFALWAFLHGRVGLAQSAARLAEATAGLDDAVRCLLEGFRARSPVPSPVPPHARLDPD